MAENTSYSILLTIQSLFHEELIDRQQSSYTIQLKFDCVTKTEMCGARNAKAAEREPSTLRRS